MERVRPPFSIKEEFVVRKPFKYGGKTYSIGDPFLWRHTTCSVKDLYKLWGVFFLECKSQKHIQGLNGTTEPDKESIPESTKVDSGIDEYVNSDFDPNPKA